jgi:uncharacterized membrane protein YhaH (DUF805 family)
MKEAYFSFEGRLGRLNFWFRSLALIVASVVLMFLLSTASDTSGVLLGIVICLPIWIAQISLNVRRLHDLNYSGWYVLVGLVPLVNVIYIIALLFVKGTAGPNKFGDDPVGAVAVAVSA